MTNDCLIITPTSLLFAHTTSLLFAHFTDAKPSCGAAPGSTANAGGTERTKPWMCLSIIQCFFSSNSKITFSPTQMKKKKNEKKSSNAPVSMESEEFVVCTYGVLTGNVCAEELRNVKFSDRGLERRAGFCCVSRSLNNIYSKNNWERKSARSDYPLNSQNAMCRKRAVVPGAFTCFESLRR